MGKFVLLTKP